MGFQNNINSALGAAGAAAGLGRYMKNQKEALVKQQEANDLAEKNKEIGKANLELKLGEQQEEAYKAEQALNANTLEVSKQMIKDMDPAVAEAQAKAFEKDETLNEDQYLELKQKLAGEAATAAEKDFNDRKLNYEWGVQKAKPSSKRFDMAQKAFMEAGEAVMARRQLHFDLEAAKKRMDITKKTLEGVK